MLYFDQTPESSCVQDMRILKRNHMQRFLKCQKSRQIMHEKQRNKEDKQRKQDFPDSGHISNSTNNFSHVNDEDWLHEHGYEHHYEHDYEHHYEHEDAHDQFDSDEIDEEDSFDECKERFDEEFKEIFGEEESDFGEEEDEDEYSQDLIEFELAQSEFLALREHSQYLEACDKTFREMQKECNEKMGDEDGADECLEHTPFDTRKVANA